MELRRSGSAAMEVLACEKPCAALIKQQTHLANCTVRLEAIPAGCVPFIPMCKRDEFFRRGVV